MASDVLFVAQPDVVDSDIGGDRALLNMKTNSYYTLNPSGAALWLALSEPRSLDELVDVIVSKFDVSADRCRADVEAVLGEMTEAGIISRIPADAEA